MNIATASGRNLFPDSFAREVLPHFNLPPMYLLMEKFIPQMILKEMKKNKEYFSRGQGILNQHESLNMLSYLQALIGFVLVRFYLFIFLFVLIHVL